MRKPEKETIAVSGEKARIFEGARSGRAVGLGRESDTPSVKLMKMA